MAARVGWARRLPVVVILGATGTGKSKLAIEIAQKFGGEIISADSMQVYQGLDIITNKVTSEELAACPHHMIDYVNPLRSNYTVVDFRDQAVPIIDRLLNERKIPVIVGGTNYYIEALLWKLLIDVKQVPNAAEIHHSDAVETSSANTENIQVPPLPQEGSVLHGIQSGKCVQESDKKITVEPNHNSDIRGDCDSVTVLSTKESSDFDDKLWFNAERIKGTTADKEGKYHGVPSEELHKMLMKVDPVMGCRLHPRNRRKIIRALQVYEDHGTPMSHILDQQHQQEGASQLSGPLRYEDPCVIWICCDQNVLDERTDKRVDSMIERGLIEELSDFHKQYNEARIKENKKADYTMGIFQSIGFKEFHKFLLLSPEEQRTKHGQDLFKAGVDELKLVTRRYARKQKKWIVNRFLKRRGSNVPAVYGVDSTDPDQWDNIVHKPAIDTVTAYIKGDAAPMLEPLPFEESTNVPAYNVCDICGGIVFVTSEQWHIHLKSKRHKKSLRVREKLKKLTCEGTSDNIRTNDDTTVESEGQSDPTVETKGDPSVETKGDPSDETEGHSDPIDETEVQHKIDPT